MQHPYLADFYHGWIIEIVQEEDGFVNVCYSSSRARLSDEATYGSESQALSAAKRIIDYQLARDALARFVREMYELDNLSFEELHLLTQSLVRTIATS